MSNRPMQSYTNGKATAVTFNLDGQSYSVRPGESIDGPVAYAKFFARQGLRPGGAAAPTPPPPAPTPDPAPEVEAAPALPGVEAPKPKSKKRKSKAKDKSED